MAAFAGEAVTNDTPSPQQGPEPEQLSSPAVPTGLTAAATWPDGGDAGLDGAGVRVGSRDGDRLRGATGGREGRLRVVDGDRLDEHRPPGGRAERGGPPTVSRCGRRARRAQGMRPTPATATTEAPEPEPLSPPGAPTGLTAAAAGRTAVALSWTAPAGGSGLAPVTGYEVRQASGRGALRVVDGDRLDGHRPPGGRAESGDRLPFRGVGDERGGARALRPIRRRRRPRRRRRR